MARRRDKAAKPRGFERLVARTRLSLNLVLVADRALAWLAPVAAGLAFLLVLVRFLSARSGGPEDGVFVAVWAGAASAALLAGGLAGSRRRLDEKAAAAWLDRRLSNGELFSAALECRKRLRKAESPAEAEADARYPRPDSADGASGKGHFEEIVLERAEASCGEARGLHPPPGPLLGRAALAVAACLLSGLLLSVAGPGSRSLAMAAVLRKTLGATVSRNAADEPEETSPATLARSLFPEDRGLGDLAESALRAGRLDEFKGLLRRAEAELGDRIARSSGEPERRRLRHEQERFDSVLDELGEEGNDGQTADTGEPGQTPDRLPEGDGGEGPSSNKNRKGPSNDSMGESPGDKSGDRSGKSPPPGDQTPGDGSGGGSGEGPGGGPGDGSGKGEKGPEGQGGPGGENSGTGGLAAGAGRGTSREWGPITPRATGPEATIAPDSQAPFYVFILPGGEAGKATAGGFAEAGKSAEAAVRREGLPMDYEDFVKSYFMELSRSASPVDAESDAGMPAGDAAAARDGKGEVR